MPARWRLWTSWTESLLQYWCYRTVEQQRAQKERASGGMTEKRWVVEGSSYALGKGYANRKAGRNCCSQSRGSLVLVTRVDVVVAAVAAEVVSTVAGLDAADSASAIAGEWEEWGVRSKPVQSSRRIAACRCRSMSSKTDCAKVSASEVLDTRTRTL